MHYFCDCVTWKHCHLCQFCSYKTWTKSSVVGRRIWCGSGSRSHNFYIDKDPNFTLLAFFLDYRSYGLWQLHVWKWVKLNWFDLESFTAQSWFNLFFKWTRFRFESGPGYEKTNAQSESDKIKRIRIRNTEKNFVLT